MAKSKSKTKDKFSPGHHMGKYYGYDVMPDGSIQLAPGLGERMDRVLNQEEGLRGFVDAANAYLTKEFARTAAERSAWWKSVAEEIGINPSDQWTYRPNERTIRRSQERPEAGPKKPDADGETVQPAKEG